MWWPCEITGAGGLKQVQAFAKMSVRRGVHAPQYAFATCTGRGFSALGMTIASFQVTFRGTSSMAMSKESFPIRSSSKQAPVALHDHQ